MDDQPRMGSADHFFLHFLVFLVFIMHVKVNMQWKRIKEKWWVREEKKMQMVEEHQKSKDEIT
jgi:hypothetical protein